MTAITGYQAIATSGPNEPPVSEFRIFADKFVLGTSVGQNPTYAPFSVDTTVSPSAIKFNGVVEFNNLAGTTGIVWQNTLTTDLARTTTVIDGGRILTGYLDAKRIAADSIWARGMIASDEFRDNTSGYIAAGTPAGFQINGTIGHGSYNYPNIYGSYIRGGTIYASNFIGPGVFGYDMHIASSCGGGRYGRLGNGKSAKKELNDGVTTVYLHVGTFYGPCYGSGFMKDRILGPDSSILIDGSAIGYIQDGGNFNLHLWVNGSTKDAVALHSGHNTAVVSHVLTGFSASYSGVYDIYIVSEQYKLSGNGRVIGTAVLSN